MIEMRIAWPTLALMLMLLCVVSGCRQPVGPTSGTVLFDDGSPVTSGSIEFRRKADRKLFASRIDGSGRFQPASSAGEVGLPVGTYEVVVVQLVLTEDLAKEAHSHGKTVPRDYADYSTSGLEIVVSDGQSDPIAIEIQTSEGS